MRKPGLFSLPLGVLLISCFYVFGAVFLLVLYLPAPELTVQAIAEYHGLPPSTGSWILPTTAVVGLVIAGGLVTRSRWGFFLAITYLVYFGFVNLYLAVNSKAWVSIGNVIWSAAVIVYLILARRWFFGAGRGKPMPARQGS